MGVALVALILALGGTAVAARKLVSGDKLIKKHSLSGNRLRNNTITGKQVNLNKLGTVPSATSAGFATRASSAGSVDSHKSWYATASVGQTPTLLTIGPFTYTAACTGTTSAPDAQTYVTTSQANSAADSYANVSGYTNAQKDPWNPGTPLSVGYASSRHTPDGAPQWVGPYDGSDTQISGDGHTIVNTFASVGTLFNGAQCVFVGHADVFTH